MWKDANWWYLQHKFNRNVSGMNTIVLLSCINYFSSLPGPILWCDKMMHLEKDETDTDEPFIKFIPRMKKKSELHCLIKKSLFIISEGEQITSTRNKKENRWLDSVQDWASWAHFCGRISYLYSNSFLSSSEIVQKWHENKKHRMHPL